MLDAAKIKDAIARLVEARVRYEFADRFGHGQVAEEARLDVMEAETDLEVAIEVG